MKSSVSAPTACPKADGTVYLEIKKKYMGVVNKRRTPLSLAEAYRFAENGKVPIKSRGLKPPGRRRDRIFSLGLPPRAEPVSFL